MFPIYILYRMHKLQITETDAFEKKIINPKEHGDVQNSKCFIKELPWALDINLIE